MLPPNDKIKERNEYSDFIIYRYFMIVNRNQLIVFKAAIYHYITFKNVFIYSILFLLLQSLPSEIKVLLRFSIM